MFRFRECREAAGISQKVAAISLGVKPPSVSDWESGRTAPTCDKLVKLAELYCVSVDELLGVRSSKTDLNYDESILLQVFRQLTPEAQSVLIATGTALLQQPGMRKESTIVSAM